MDASASWALAVREERQDTSKLAAPGTKGNRGMREHEQ
jgi:hypothetical protein